MNSNLVNLHGRSRENTKTLFFSLNPLLRSNGNNLDNTVEQFYTCHKILYHPKKYDLDVQDTLYMHYNFIMLRLVHMFFEILTIRYILMFRKIYDILQIKIFEIIFKFTRKLELFYQNFLISKNSQIS